MACMKAAIIFILGVVAMPVLAATNSLITDDKATVVVQGNAEDTDAVSLFRAMNVEVVDSGSSVTKVIQLKDKNENPIFDLTCELANANENRGSCNLIIYKSRFAKINSANAEVAFAVGAYDFKDFVTKFNVVDPDMGGDVFLSHDDKLGIAVGDLGSPRAVLRIWIRAH